MSDKLMMISYREKYDQFKIWCIQNKIRYHEALIQSMDMLMERGLDKVKNVIKKAEKLSNKS